MVKIRIAFMALLFGGLAALSCSENYNVDGWDTRKFQPHVATSWRWTAAGHQRDAGPFDSVTRGYVSEAEIDAAIDQGFVFFAAIFPELGLPEARVHLTEDYVFWYGGRWAGGANEGEDCLVPIFTRGTSTTDPGDQFIKRAPDANWTWWRFTSRPLVPALPHELLHRCIGDPNHARPEWKRLQGTVEEKTLVRCYRDFKDLRP